MQPAPSHRLDVDVGFVKASLREIIGHLQPQPGFRATAECLVEAHGGRLWATPNLPQGAVLQFTLPQR